MTTEITCSPATVNSSVSASLPQSSVSMCRSVPLSASSRQYTMGPRVTATFPISSLTLGSASMIFTSMANSRDKRSFGCQHLVTYRYPSFLLHSLFFTPSMENPVSPSPHQSGMRRAMVNGTDSPLTSISTCPLLGSFEDTVMVSSFPFTCFLMILPM